MAVVWVAASMALEPSEMNALVEQHHPSLLHCGARNGEVYLRWEFDGDSPGWPVAVQVLEARGIGASIAQCIAEVSLRWEFPARGEVFEYTLKFRTPERICTPEGRWLHYSMGSVVAAVLEEDTVDVQAAEVRRAESTLLEALALVDGVAPESVFLYRYPSTREKEARTGRRGNAHACDDSIHSVVFDDRHELMHVATRDWRPLPLLQEGLAVWFSGGFQGRNPDTYACDLVRAGEWIPAQILLDVGTFSEENRRSPRAYGVAAGIVGTAIDLVGVDGFLTTYRAGWGIPVFVGDAECYDVASIEAIHHSLCVQQ